MKTDSSHNFFGRIRFFIKSHKFLSFLIFVAIGFSIYTFLPSSSSTKSTTQYVLAKVEKGTVISTLTGTGQVSASDQIDLKPKVSGDITWIGVKAGDEVKKGQALFGIDSTEIQKSIRDAQSALRQAELALEQDTAQAPIDYQKKQKTLSDAKNDLEDSYDDSFVAISNAFLNLPSIVTTAEDVLYGTDLSPQTGQWNIDAYKNSFITQDDKDKIQLFAEIAKDDYKVARAKYDTSFAEFKKLTLYSNNDDIEKVLSDTSDAATAIAQALKSEKNLIDTVLDLAEQRQIKANTYISTTQSTLATKIGTANSQITSLTTQERTVENLKDTINETEQDITIYKINNESGNDPLSLQTERNEVEKKRQTLSDLKSDLTDYTITAPFAGIMAKVDVEKGDSASSGTALGTIITKQQIAEISLNEIDIAKTKVGQKATITLDAVGDLIVTGKVEEVDLIGTASQGVVTYKVKIALDTLDDRIKSGMSLSASIITDMKSDAVLVPNTAIKTENGSQYVEVPVEGLYDATAIGSSAGVSSTAIKTTKKQVTTGITDDTNTEILGGLSEGDVIVSKTTTQSSTATKTTSSSSSKNAFSILGGNGGPR